MAGTACGAAAVTGVTAGRRRPAHAGGPLLRRLPMVLDAGTRLLVSRHALHEVRLAPDADAPAARPLADGEARLAVERFAFTAHNVSCAAFGEAMRCWQFFPTGDAAWGCVPVWGFATVTESRAEGVLPGMRLYGYLPMGTHLVVQPAAVHAGGFRDASPHRAGLAVFHNLYRNAGAADPQRDAMQALLEPLFATAFLIDDFLGARSDVGSAQVLLSSASSKTALATAFCLARRAAAPHVVGLTSAAHVGHVASLGLHAEVVAYEAIERLDPSRPTMYVDFAGHADLRRRVHEHFAGTLRYSCAVGGTHWRALGSTGPLPGPPPEPFFAPAQLQRRSAAPPAGWGAEGLRQRLDSAWQQFVSRAADPTQPWVEVQEARGAAAVEEGYRTVLSGKSDPAKGWMLTF